MEREMTLEEQATEILKEDAKQAGKTLYKMGIIDNRRRYMIDRREIAMSRFEKRNQR